MPNKSGSKGWRTSGRPIIGPELKNILGRHDSRSPMTGEFLNFSTSASLPLVKYASVILQLYIMAQCSLIIGIAHLQNFFRREHVPDANEHPSRRVEKGAPFCPKFLAGKIQKVLYSNEINKS